jgi:hypothetical protein
MVTRPGGPIVALALALCTCELGPLSLVGLECTDAHPCAEGLACVEGRCAEPLADAGTDAGVDAGTDAGPADAGRDAGIAVGQNLLLNAGFEAALKTDGGVVGWRAVAGLLTLVDGGSTGQRSARLEANTPNQQPQLTTPTSTPGTELGTPFCAQLWVRSDAPDGGADVTLNIREHFDDGGTRFSPGTRVNAVKTGWVRLSEYYVAAGGGSIDVRAITARLDAGEGLTFDDAVLQRVSALPCP